MTLISNRYAHAVVCEDVRQEVGNKLSLMGIWGSDLNIEGVPPIVLPKLAIVGWIISPIERPFKEATIRVKALDQSEITQTVTLQWTSPAKPASRNLFAQFVIGLGNMQISGPGTIETFVDIERETFLANRVHVHLNAPAATNREA